MNTQDVKSKINTPILIIIGLVLALSAILCYDIFLRPVGPVVDTKKYEHTIKQNNQAIKQNEKTIDSLQSVANELTDKLKASQYSINADKKKIQDSKNNLHDKQKTVDTFTNRSIHGYFDSRYGTKQ